jgi:DNA-binding transcriptional LysR family regulator
VELRQLRYFVAVAEERHFTRAAARLGVAQPSVSSQVRKLEIELGGPLFDRGPAGAEMTQAGEVLLPLARRVLDDVEDALSQVREVGGLGRGRLAVGATPSLSTGLLPAALARFHRAYPGVAVSLFEEGSGGLVERLESGEIELALVILPLRQARLSTRALASEELVLVTATDHPFAGRAEMEVAELREVALVMFREGYDLRTATFGACRAAGFEPVLATEGGEMDGVLAVVGAGLGAAVVPSIVAATRAELATIRFRSPSLRRTIGLARRPDRAASRAATAFEAEVEDLVRGGGWPGVAPAGLVVL